MNSSSSALSGLVEVVGSVSSTHIAANDESSENTVPGVHDILLDLPLTPINACNVQTYIQAKPHTH